MSNYEKIMKNSLDMVPDDGKLISYKGKENVMKHKGLKEMFFFAYERVLLIVDIVIVDLLGDIIIMGC